MGEFTLQKATGKLTGEFFLGKISFPAKETHKLSATMGKSNSERSAQKLSAQRHFNVCF